MRPPSDRLDRPGPPDMFAGVRQRMVQEQLAGDPERPIRNSAVLAAMTRVPRHEFVPASQHAEAYMAWPLPIGFGQTISQPYIVALMTEELDPQPTDRVLEIGTGSGYQAAVLSGLVAAVFTVEIVEPLARDAAARLGRLGCRNVQVRAGDGHEGWPEAAPFDAIIVTCAPESVPPQLLAQLRDGGRLIIPVGPLGDQELRLLEQRPGRPGQRAVLPVRFVPMTRGAGRSAVPATFNL